MRTLKFGVEIELFGVTVAGLINELRRNDIKVADFAGYTHKVITEWKVTTDVSVTSTGTGTGKGLELVSPILYGEAGLAELERVCEVLNKIGARVDKTCGLHVHFDIADYTAQNMKSFINLWYQNKYLINGLVAKSRRKNQYCMNINEIEVKKINLNSVYSIEQIAGILYTRYKTINLQSYIKYGTLEIRQHGGTTDFEKMEAWIVMIYQMLAVAKEQNIPMASTVRSNSVKRMNEFMHDLRLDDTYTADYLLERQSYFKEAN